MPNCTKNNTINTNGNTRTKRGRERQRGRNHRDRSQFRAIKLGTYYVRYVEKGRGRRRGRGRGVAGAEGGSAGDWGLRRKCFDIKNEIKQKPKPQHTYTARYSITLSIFEHTHSTHHTHTYRHMNTSTHTPRHTHKANPNGKSQIEKHKTQIQRQAKREDYGEIQQQRMGREEREKRGRKREEGGAEPMRSGEGHAVGLSK